MNPKILIAVIVCVSLCVLTCTNPSSPGTDHNVTIADQYEPDNSQSSAKEIEPDSAGQFRTLKKGDTDWVYFSAVSGRSYKIFTAGSTDTRIKVYSYTGSTPIVEGDDSPGSVNASVVFNCSSTNTYYICVSGNDVTVTGAYELSVLSSVGPDVYEPDSIPSYSNSISTTSYQNRTIQLGDIDWVDCSIAANDTVLLTAAGSCRVLVTLYDRDTLTPLAASVAGDSIALIRHRVAATGTYFIKVVAQISGANGTYRLTMQTSSSGTLVVPDAYENDNTRGLAKLISGNSVAQQRSLTPGDTDWVMIPVVGGRQYNVTFLSSYSVLATMYAKDGMVLQGPLSSLFLNSSATDTVYVKMYSSATTGINYSLNLSVQLQPTIPDEYEVDNTKAQAKAKYFPRDSLFQDRTLTAVNYVSDTDWVAFPVMAGKQYTIRAITSSSTTLYMYLYDNVSTGYVQYSSLSSSSITYSPTVSDTVYLQLYRPYGSTAVAYTLSVRGQFYNDSYEPDSSRSTAKTLSTSIQNRILLPGDTDWVMYTATPGDSIAIVTTGTTDTKISLFSSSGSTPMVENDDIGTGNTNAMVSWKSSVGGQFYIRIVGKTPLVTGPYVLQALSVLNGTLVSADSLENDNTKARARVISDTLLSLEAHTLTMNDTDWVAFPVLAGGQYTVTASSTTYLSMYAYTSKDSLIGSRVSTTSASITYTPMKNDTMYVRVSSSYTVQRYTLSMSRIAPPSPDAYENDNTRASAYKASGSFSQARTITVGDTDWVSVPVLAGGRYTMSTSTTRVPVYLYNQAGVLLGSSVTGSLAFTATAADTFYYQMYAATGYPTSPYTLTLTVVLPVLADSYESDNTMATAKTLLTDSTVQDRTITLADTDWVSFRGNAGDRVTIRAAQTSAYYTYIYIYDSTGISQTYTSSISGGVSLTYTVPRTGLFYCRINSLSTGSYAYSLTASLRKMDTLAIGTSSSRTLIARDSQWVAIRLDSGRTYTIQTTGSLDMLMWLYDSLKAPSYLLYDDDGGVSTNALLTYVPRRTGLFFLKVSGISLTTAGSFGLIATVSGALSTVAGTWSITYIWGSVGSGSTAAFVLDPAGTFTVGTSSGTWTYVGTTLTLTYPSGTVYTGTVTGNTVSGTMTSSTQTGTFTGVKQ